jgi:hypothetical protein
MGSLAEDAQTYAERIAAALTQSGYQADFSLESLRDVDRFFDEHSANGEPIPGGLLSEQLGARLFGIGAYVGEVLRRLHGGHWQGNDEDSEGEINVAVVFPDGSTIWPVQRVMKRLRNGAEDSIYPYGRLIAPRAP